MSQERDDDLHPVSIDLSDPVRPRVTLDGRDVSRDVASGMLSWSKRELPEVVLNLQPTAGSQFDGFARVVIGIPPDLGPAAEAFLAAIDPDELERVALNRMGLSGDGEESLTATMLKTLREWARGGA